MYHQYQKVRVVAAAASKLFCENSRPLLRDPRVICSSSSRWFASQGQDKPVTITHVESSFIDNDAKQMNTLKEAVTLRSSDTGKDNDDDAMEQEEMFVDPHETFEHPVREWGGPRRGGRLAEPTRFGDWERKGRCTDF